MYKISRAIFLLIFIISVLLLGNSRNMNNNISTNYNINLIQNSNKKGKENMIEKNIVPEWANFFESNEYDLFIKEIKDYFMKKGMEINIHDGILFKTNLESQIDEFGLSNIGRSCKSAGIDHYKELIKEYFDNLEEVEKFSKEFEKISDDFSKIKDYIGVRIYPEIDDNKNMIKKKLTDGLYIVIVFDTPISTTTVNNEKLKKWNKNIDELVEVGRENIKTKYYSEISEEVIEGTAIILLLSDNFFVTNKILDIEITPKYIGKYGSIIGIPTRNIMVIHPINDINKTVPDISTLISIVHNASQKEPGKISEKLFWYKDGKYKEVPYKIEKDQVQFLPPEDFIDMMNELAEKTGKK